MHGCRLAYTSPSTGTRLTAQRFALRCLLCLGFGFGDATLLLLAECLALLGRPASVLSRLLGFVVHANDGGAYGGRCHELKINFVDTWLRSLENCKLTCILLACTSIENE